MIHILTTGGADFIKFKTHNFFIIHKSPRNTTAIVYGKRGHGISDQTAASIRISVSKGTLSLVISGISMS